jgi:hypothetical protein
MNLVILELVNDKYIICDLERLDDEPSYYLKNPYVILENYDYYDTDKELDVIIPYVLLSKKEERTGVAYEYITLEKYPKFTIDEGCLMYTDKIITMVEPELKVAELYVKVIGG